MDKSEQYARGVLYSKDSQEHYILTRIEPSSKLSDFIETFWHVEWNLSKTDVHHQQNIPDPCVNMVFQENLQEVIGVISKRYSTTLKGKGSIFGIKFRAGAFSLFSDIKQSQLRDKSLPLTDIFGDEILPLINKVGNAKDIKSKVSACEIFLERRKASSSRSLTRLTNLIEEIENNPSVTKVCQLSERFDYPERNLQRLFKQMIGISPKWVIKKYRIQEVLSQFEDGNFNWQDLLETLGYFDQSHFNKDFKDFIGLTPKEYIEHIKNL